MKANQLATLVLRLLGIYCLLQVVPAISITSSVAPIISSQDKWGGSEIIEVAIVILLLALQLAFGILLIVKSVPWGEKLAPQNSGEANIPTVSFEQIPALAFAVVGALIFAGGLSQLFGSIYSASVALEHSNKEQYPAGMQLSDWRLVLFSFGVILKTTIGAWMFFGARGFANLWRTLQNFGTPKPPEN